MFQRFFYERQSIKLKELIGFSQLSSLVIQEIFKCNYLCLRNSPFDFLAALVRKDCWMDMVDEEVDSEIKFQFWLFT